MTTEPTIDQSARCRERVELFALPGVPIAIPGDDVAALVMRGIEAAAVELCDADVLVVSSKMVSRAEGRFCDLARVVPGERARELARVVEKDPRLVEVILQESEAVSRSAPNVLIVRHRLGFVSANAGIDMSNAEPPHAAPGSGPWVLLIPRDPDATAERIRAAVEARFAARIGVVISDSLGRPFRLGSVGAAIGVAGLPALDDMRGKSDLFGRPLEHTITALADQVAAAADLVAGQSSEGRAVVLVRGLAFVPLGPGQTSTAELLRRAGEDLYA